MLSQALWAESQLLSGINRLAQTLDCALLGGERLNGCGQNLEQYAESLGIEALPTQTTFGELPQTLGRLVPGIVSLTHNLKPAYVFISGRRGKQLQLLLPEGGNWSCGIAELAEFIGRNRGCAPDPGTEAVLLALGLQGKRLARASHLLIQQQLAAHPIRGLWLLRPHASQGLKVAAKHARLGRYALGFAAAHLAERATLIAGVSLLGYAITQGIWGISLVASWLLIMLSHWAFAAFGQTCQLQLDVRVGVIVKRQLQHSALRLSAEAHAKKGPAQLLGQAMEADGLQNNALPGVFAAVNAGIDMFIGLGIALFFQQWLLATLLVAFLLASSYPIIQFGQAYRGWASRRTQLSQLTIEHIQGSRTRLMQSSPERWHQDEERQLQQYWLASVQMDRYALWLQALIPSLWLISASAILCIAIMFSDLDIVQLAALLGVILMVWQAWHSMADSCQQLVRSWHSWQEIQDLLRQNAQAHLAPLDTSEPQVSLATLAVNQVSFGYAANRPILRGVTMHLQKGQQYLLQGESGSGKSTLLALLAGQASPQQGWLLCNDRDLQTLGHQYWRKKICWVPQYHENYLFSATLLFNLLLGRNWPPTQQDLDEAVTVCDKLGLTPLLNKMPAGILQSVGEMGWQLSQGERSRVYLARALLQKPDFLLLDESLGALDSATSLRILASLQTESAATLLCMHP
ncbi:MAG: ABC transporter ATP-binding protein [Pseudomonadota bacterium]